MAHVLNRRHALRRAGLVAAGLLVGCEKSPSGGAAPAAPAASFHGIDITGANYAQGFELPDSSGRARSLAEFRGKAVVVFFGYTQCPDVCPTTMAEIAYARRLLGADGARVQPVFISVDPARDTPEVLARYGANFGADVVTLRAEEPKLAELAKHFKVFYAKVPGQTPTSYTIDHTAGSYVFDPAGRIRLFARHGAGAQALADDLKVLLASTAG